MKRIVSIVCIVVLVGPAFAFAETPVDMKARLELEYQPHRRTQQIGWIAAGVGMVVAVGVVAGFDLENPDSEMSGGQIAGAVVGSILFYGGVGTSVINLIRTRHDRRDIRKWQYVLDGFTARESDAIVLKGFFVGMSQDALRLAKGRPQRINVTQTVGSRSEQWVYPNGLYIYTDGRRVMSYQRTR